MFKRRFTLLLLFVLLFSAFSAAAVMAQAPFVSIVSPTNGAVVDTANVAVQVSFGNAPEGGGGLLVRAYDSNNNLLGQSATNDLSSIPWNTTVSISAASGSTGYLVASMLDGSGVTVATSPNVTVSYGNAPPPTTPPTATFTPTTPPTATSPGPQPSITIVSPTANAVVDPINGFNVAGSTSNLPAGSTIQVRLRNANGDTLGEQSVVPVSGQPWSVFILKSLPNVPTTGGGSIVAFVLLNGNFVAQTNVIPLQFSGQPPQAIVTITSPTAGSSVNRTNPVIVSGTSSGLPTGTTIQIRGFINSGPTLIASGTAQTAANGTWSAQIGFGGTPPSGTQGYLVATAVSGNNTLAVSSNVPVIWTGNVPPTNPVIQITFPPSGAVVGANGTLVQVTGFAANLFESSLTVRALDAFGNTLASQPLTYDQNGNWTVNLAVNVAPGTPGSLYAFALSPQNGQVVASARVNVFFGGQCFVRTDLPIYVVQPGDTLNKIASRTGSTVSQLAVYNCINNVNLLFVGQQLRVPQLPVVATPTAPPVQTTLRILTPVQNAVLDPSQRVIVAGSGRALAGNDVVVRVLDSNGNLLTQQTTRVGQPSANGESQWQVSLGFSILNSTQGSIYAFAQNPTTGAIMANALVDVTFSAPIIVEPVPGTQQLIITQPTSNASVTPSGQLQVSGQLLDGFDGDVFVRILDPNGNTILEVPATVGQPDAQGNATWQALLDVNMQNGIWGTIFAYSPTPFQITPLVADAVNVVFGQPSPGPYVTISDPLPFSIVNTAAPFNVMGRGGRLFEGNVVVRALDERGNVLAEAATIVNSPNAGTGGEGDWQTSLSVNVPDGTRGSIVALSESAQDGSVVAFASVYVTYGDPTENANFVRINAPLPGSAVDPSQTLMIGGTADRNAGNSVTVQIVDDRGNVLVEQPRNLNPSVDGDFGIWQMIVELRGMSAGTHLRINAYTGQSDSGAAAAADSVDITVGETTVVQVQPSS